MTPELRHLRAFRAAAAAPDDEARAAARAALLAEIEGAAQPASSARPAAPARRARGSAARPVRRRRHLLAGLGGLATAGAVAVAIALGTGLGGGDVQPQPASAAAVLRAAASAAAAQPYMPLRPGQYWYVRTETVGAVQGGPTSRPWSATVVHTSEQWTAPGERGRFLARRTGPPVFDDARQRRNWVADGRPQIPRRTESRSGRLPAQTRFGALGAIDPATLPTDPDALYAQIERGTRALMREHEIAEDRLAEAIWSTLYPLVSEPGEPLPPRVRAALYGVLAKVPEIALRGDAEDARGRRGRLLAIELRGVRWQLVVDPATGALLELRQSAPGHAPGRVTFVASGVVDSRRARP